MALCFRTQYMKMKNQKYKHNLTSKEVVDWFTQNSSTMVVALDSNNYFGTDVYISENENVFFSGDGKEKLTCEVSYDEGCPTCGGAYVKRWTLRYL